MSSPSEKFHFPTIGNRCINAGRVWQQGGRASQGRSVPPKHFHVFHGRRLHRSLGNRPSNPDNLCRFNGITSQAGALHASILES